MKSSTNVIVLGKQKMGNNPQLYGSNLTHFELPSMQAETTYKTKKIKSQIIINKT